MWDGITHVAPNHDPIIYEGLRPATLVVTNAGPAGVSLLAWQSHAPKDPKPDIQIQLWPGNTRSVSASLVRARLMEGVGVAAPSLKIPAAYAALGWRVTG
jgi:hypothetical protein